MSQPQRPDPGVAAVGAGVAANPSAHCAAWPNTVNRLLWVLLVVLAAWLVHRSATRHLRDDETEAIHTAWLVSQGERPYADFFQHHHPLLYYVLSPVVAACGESVGTLVACRLVNLVFLAGIFIATYWLAARLFDRSAALLAVLFLIASSGFIELAIEVRPDVPQALFGLLAMVLFFPRRPTDDRSARPSAEAGRRVMARYFLAGLCLGVAFLFLQKAIFVIAVLGAVLLYRLVRKEAKTADVVACAAGGLVALFPFGVWLVVCNSPKEYYFLNWTLNMHFLGRFSALPLAMHFYQQSTLLFVCAGIAVALFLTNARQRELAAVAALLLASLFTLRHPWGQYWLPIYPLLAVLAGHGLATVWRDRPRIAAVLLAFVLFLPLVTAIHQPFWGKYATLRQQWQKPAYVLSRTDPNDCVYDPSLSFNLFRRDIDYMWLLTGYQLETYQELRPDYAYDVYRLIEKNRPKVISDVGIPNMEDPRIRDHYQRDDRYPDLFTRRD